MNQTAYTEWHGIRRLDQILQENHYYRILLVRGQTSFTQSGAADTITLLRKKYHIEEFIPEGSLPNLPSVIRGIHYLRSRPADVVLAIGGGNILDSAKSIAALSPQKEGDYELYVKGQLPLTIDPLPQILVPTTAGTGSEATHFAVVYINQKKYSLADPRMLPTYAIVDPALTENLPQYVAACSGADALAQAIESFWSAQATHESQRYSREAIRLILPALPSLAGKPTREEREALSYGSHIAGKAINLARTTAPHAFSYPLSARFNIPHGHAVSLTLPSFFSYNAHVQDETAQDSRGLAYVQETLGELCRLLDVPDADTGKEKLHHLFDTIGLQRTLTPFGVREYDLPSLLEESAGQERMLNNPRKADRTELTALLHHLL